MVTDIEEFYLQKRHEQYSESTIYGISSFLYILFKAGDDKAILNFIENIGSAFLHGTVFNITINLTILR